MSIKLFLKKIGGAISKAGRWVKNKAIPFVGRLAKPILNGISMLPGKLGLIGKLGSALTGIAGGVVDQIPNDKVRDKVRNWIDHEAKLGRTAIDKAQDIAQRTNNTIDDVRNRFNNEVKPLIKPIISSNAS